MRKLPKLEEIFSPEVVAQVQVALQEVGEIQPWFDSEVNEWVFEHPLYPESYGGETPEEVIAGYPLYLGNLIQARMDGSLAPETEVRILGRGGRRPGSGRPKGSRKEAKQRIYLPTDIVQWLRKDPSRLEAIRKLISNG